MTSFSIYNNIPKTITKSEIMTLNFDFDIKNITEYYIGSIPLNISILGMTISLPLQTGSVLPVTFYCNIKNVTTGQLIQSSTISTSSQTKCCGSFNPNINSNKETEIYLSTRKGLKSSGILTIHYYQM